MSRPETSTLMITVYGADWCEDTRRSQRLLRRLHVPHRYVNIDDDLDGLERAKALNHGERRTPTIDLGLGGEALVEPDNDTLAAALVEREMLTVDEAHERLGIQNVGDIERVARTTLGAALFAGAAAAPRSLRWPLRLAGLFAAATGISGWCPASAPEPEQASQATWVGTRISAPRPLKHSSRVISRL